MSSLTRAYFEDLYAKSGDPWRFASSAYERAKYAASLAALPDARYARALEIGCSIGVFTAALAERCDALLAVDVSSQALARARNRCGRLPNVDFAQVPVPHAFPTGTFDLVMLCEVGYYWDDVDAAAAKDRIADALAPGGTLLLTHLSEKVPDYCRSGDDVHEAYRADGRFAPVFAERAPRYRIDVLRRRVRSAPGDRP